MGYAGGFVGKIAVVDLSSGVVETISSEPYQSQGGGYASGLELMFDLSNGEIPAEGFDPKSIFIMFASGLSGTGVPSASERTICTFPGVQGFPKPWITRSGWGGRFGPMMKAAGFDAIAIKGQASKPVWVNVVDGEVTIESAEDLWGLGTIATQEEIWSRVRGNKVAFGDWLSTGGKRDSGRSTLRPVVAAIGPAGENKVRTAAIISDTRAGGQGGPGAVWGSKNLKAVSVYGTGSVPVSDPTALINLRLQVQQKYGYPVDEVNPQPSPVPGFSYWGLLDRGPGFGALEWYLNAKVKTPHRPHGCSGCYICCRNSYSDGLGNGEHCVESLFWGSDGATNQRRIATMLNDLGLNAFQLGDPALIVRLNQAGIVGPGMKIDSKLPFDRPQSVAFAEEWLKAVAYRTDIGADWAEGPGRALTKWGLWDELSADGSAAYPYHGYTEHYDPRIEVDWSYAGAIGSRDRNLHSYNWEIHWLPTVMAMTGSEPDVPAETLAQYMAEATELGDPMCFDYSEEGIYSDARLDAVRWLIHYGEYYLQSVGFCDWAWPHFTTHRGGDTAGKALEHYEHKFWTAVTGEEIDTEKAQEKGRKQATIERALFTLQGRTRDNDKMEEYVFSVPTSAPYFLPAYIDGKWTYDACLNRTLDKAKWEDVKTRIYKAEGWADNGVPTKETLESMGYERVAEALSKAGAL